MRSRHFSRCRHIYWQYQDLSKEAAYGSEGTYRPTAPDPNAVQSLMTSADGQRLMQLLSGGDGGRTLQQAAGEAAAGNTLQMAQMLKSVMSTPEGAAPAAGASGTVCRDREEDGSVSEMDEKLNTLLSDPGSMARIMQLGSAALRNYGRCREDHTGAATSSARRS